MFGRAAAAAYLEVLDEERQRRSCRAGRRPGSRRTCPGRTSGGRWRWSRRSAATWRAYTTGRGGRLGLPSGNAASVGAMSHYRPERLDACRTTSLDDRSEMTADCARRRSQPAPRAAPPPSVHAAAQHAPRLPARGRQARASASATAPRRTCTRLHRLRTNDRRPRARTTGASVPVGARGRVRTQWNESPQAQEPVALGLSIVKPCFSMRVDEVDGRAVEVGDAHPVDDDGRRRRSR